MEFSNTTTEDGCMQEVDRICGTTNATYKLKAKVARFNQALDDFHIIALKADKSWQYDDANIYEQDGTTVRNLPIAVTNLNAGQQDYPFATELLTVHAVFAKDEFGVYKQLTEQNDYREQNTFDNVLSGTPREFKLIGTSILLDQVPNYDSKGGLKVVFTRNGSKFTDADSEKEPGIPSLFHPWLCRSTALPYLIEKKLPQAGAIAQLVAKGEVDIKAFMSNRNRTREPRLSPRRESFE